MARRLAPSCTWRTEGSDTVSVVNWATHAALATIPVGIQPYGVVYYSTAKEIYVCNIGSNTVSVIDADPASGNYNTVRHTITVGVQPFYVAVLGVKLYVTNNLSNTVSVITAASHTVTATVPVGNNPLGIKGLRVSPIRREQQHRGQFRRRWDGRYGLGDRRGDDLVDATIWQARGLAVWPSRARKYIAKLGAGTVSVINSATNLVTHTITVGWGARRYGARHERLRGELRRRNRLRNRHWISLRHEHRPGRQCTCRYGSGGRDIYLSRFTDQKLTALDGATNTLVPARRSPVASWGMGMGASLMGETPQFLITLSAVGAETLTRMPVYGRHGFEGKAKVLDYPQGCRGDGRKFRQRWTGRGLVDPARERVP